MLPYFLGLPMWGQKSWAGSFFPREVTSRQHLPQYASVFNTVEGNTTFYALPTEETVLRWRHDTPPGFRFVFKLPKSVSHGGLEYYSKPDFDRFFDLMSILHDRLGPLWLQLPAAFAPDDLPALERFIRRLPAAYHYVVEVRHPDFFTQGDEEKQLLDLLHHWQIDRVTFDSRALFSCPLSTPAVAEAKRKKPNLPVRPVATSSCPVVRYISHPHLERNDDFLMPWVEQLGRWVASGRQPFMFIHTPDNEQAPELAYRFHRLLQARLEGLGDLPAMPVSRVQDTGQLGLF